MKKLTDEELWDALDEAGLDAEIETALAQTPEEHLRELIAAGFTLEELDAKADACFASLADSMPAVPKAPVAPARLPDGTLPGDAAGEAKNRTPE